MTKESKRNTILIFAVCSCFVLLAVGYAAFRESLSISGTAGVGNASWEIKFTSIKKNEELSTEGVKEVEAPIAVGNSITFNVELGYPTARLVYDIEITNSGTIDAKFEGFNGLETINNETPSDIKYTIQKLNNSKNLTQNEELNAGQSDQFRVVVEWVSTENPKIPESADKSGTIYINYVQKTA